MPAPDSAAALAVAMHAAPGRFALLIGSGVSMAAGIPTGWTVVSDLAGRLAVAEGAEEPPADPVEWFFERHGEAPDYSTLLEGLAPTPAQRRDLLASYFEPTEDELEAGEKQPTRAHRAIAATVARGTVRVIVTTNFDRLMEQALQAHGIEPVVVATADAARGTILLAHTRCTIIKVHGDYLDPNIKNTVGELDSYDQALDQLLDRAFDDYGLVVCGWSASWDRALRHAIERCATRRYGTYLAARGTPTEEAQQLIAQRDATLITIEDADSFFDTLLGRIEALDDLSQRDSTSIEVVAAQAKRYLPDPVHRIRLHDLVMDAGARALSATGFSVQGASLPADDYLAKAAVIEDAAGGVVVAHAVLGAFGDTDDHYTLVRRSLERLAGPGATLLSGLTALIYLRLYPALLAMYATGIASTAAENWAVLPALLTARTVVPNMGTASPVPAADVLQPFRVLDGGLINTTFTTNNKTPLSDYLHDRLAVLLRPALRLGEDEYADIFDSWEYLLGVVGDDLGPSGVVGRWAWRGWPTDHVPRGALEGAADDLLRAGLFKGNPDHLREMRNSFEQGVQRTGLRRL